MSRREVRIAPRHSWRPMAEKLFDRAEIHTGHHDSRRKGVAVTMPGVVMDARLFQGGLEPVAMSPQLLAVLVDEYPRRIRVALFQFPQHCECDLATVGRGSGCRQALSYDCPRFGLPIRRGATPFLGEYGVQETALPHPVELEVLDEKPLLSHAHLL